MWSSNRRTVLALGLSSLALAACGFSPAYGPGGVGSALRGSIELPDPQDRDGYDFHNRLRDRLGDPTAPRYRLVYSLSSEPVGAGILPSGAITRYTLTGRARYNLVALDGGAILTSGQVESFTSWSTSGSTVATLSAEADAHRRLMVILADQLMTRLLAANLP